MKTAHLMNRQKFTSIVLISILLTCINFFLSGQQKIINANIDTSNVLNIAVNHDAHEDYGLAFPATYIVKYPLLTDSVRVLFRYSSTEEWTSLEEKSSNDFFNGINAFRISNSDSTVYISVNFNENTDSLFIKLEDKTANTIPISYNGVAKYYDNRKAAVTASADDWSDAFNAKFKRAAAKFTSYKVYLSVAIITGSNSESTWSDIQSHLDKGYIEAAAHTRNHPHTEYSNIESEVKGARNDIINNLDLPNSYRKGNKEYVYTWIAPYGDYTKKTEDMVSKSKFLVSRLYTYHDDSVAIWNSNEKMFTPINSTIELGNLPWNNPSGEDGVENVSQLNSSFDNIYAKNGVYHVMCHPNVIDEDWDETYLDEHLSYISGRKDVWYAPLGLLYVYQLMYQNPLYEADKEEPVLITENISIGEQVKNYPNPFSESTTFFYSVNKPAIVEITIYDSMGRLVKSLVNENQMSGNYAVKWTPDNLSSGNYFYDFNVNGLHTYKKLVYCR